jgi:hypothetical protein
MKEKKQDFSIIKRNILKYANYKGFSKYEIYQKTGISRSVLSQNNGLTEDNLLKFLAYYTDVNPEWLLTGKGEMLRNIDNHSANQSIIGSNNKMAGKNIGNDNEHHHLLEINNLKKQIENKDNIINSLIKQQEILINKLAKL